MNEPANGESILRGSEPHTSWTTALITTNTAIVIRTVAKWFSARIGRMAVRSTTTESTTPTSSPAGTAAHQDRPAPSMSAQVQNAGNSPSSAIAKLGTSVAFSTRTMASAMREYQLPACSPLMICCHTVAPPALVVRMLTPKVER